MTQDLSRPLVQRLSELAGDDPRFVAVQGEDGSLTRGEIERRSDAWARELLHLGVSHGDFVAILLPNSLEFVVVTVAVWKVGATPAPLSAKLTETELEGMLDLLRPPVVIGGEGASAGSRTFLPADHVPAEHPEIELDRTLVSPAWKAIGSGGSTGRPKVIVTPSPATLGVQIAAMGAMRIEAGELSIITAPLSHNGPFISLLHTLLLGGKVVLTGRFDAEKLLRTIESQRATWVYLVPTMMSRIWKLPSEVRDRYDLSSLRTAVHMGAPCPAWLKHAWIEWLGASRLLELYTSTEAVSIFSATGNEWLEHPGTVGRPLTGDVQVRDAFGSVLPPNTTGLIWVLRDPDLGPSYQYLGAEAKSDEDGWQTLGDIGRLDDDGYLYVEDRESDMMLVGGSNVYPAEVESALLDHPAVMDACVFGMPDDDLGQAPHAIIFASKAINPGELDTHVRNRVAVYKRPRSYEFVDGPIRDAAGKVRRQRLRADRITLMQSSPR